MITSQTIATATRLGGALALALALAGCANFSGSAPYDEAYPINVAEEPVLIEVPLGQKLSRRDEIAIGALARDYAKRGVGELTIAYPQGAAEDPAVAAVAERLHAAGAPTRQTRRGAYDPSRTGFTGIVVSFYAPTARDSGCPDLWGDTTFLPGNEHSGRLGCAYQQNLAAMIADPRDLTAPAPMGPAGADRRRRVIQADASGEATAAEGSATAIDTRN